MESVFEEWPPKIEELPAQPLIGTLKSPKERSDVQTGRPSFILWQKVSDNGLSLFGLTSQKALSMLGEAVEYQFDKGAKEDCKWPLILKEIVMFLLAILMPPVSKRNPAYQQKRSIRIINYQED